jgi:hypothetical protein
MRQRRVTNAAMPSGYAAGVGRDGTFQAACAAIHRRRAGFILATRGFRDAAIDREVVPLQPDDLVVGGQSDRGELLSQVTVSPVGDSAADGALGASPAGDDLVTRTMHRGGDDVLEHNTIGNPASVTPPRMGRGKRSVRNFMITYARARPATGQPRSTRQHQLPEPLSSAVHDRHRLPAALLPAGSTVSISFQLVPEAIWDRQWRRARALRLPSAPTKRGPLR